MSDVGWEARASQFLPFAALDGYGDAVRAATRRGEPRRGLSEEGAGSLAAEVSALSRGERVAVEFHDGERYVTREGAVRQVDLDLRVLRLEGLDVPFDDLWSVRRAR